MGCTVLVVEVEASPGAIGTAKDGCVKILARRLDPRLLRRLSRPGRGVGVSRGTRARLSVTVEREVAIVSQEVGFRGSGAEYGHRGLQFYGGCGGQSKPQIQSFIRFESVACGHKLGPPLQRRDRPPHCVLRRTMSGWRWPHRSTGCSRWWSVKKGGPDLAACVNQRFNVHRT